MEKVYVYDTTLRDGNQARGISLSLEDKLLIAQKLDELGVDYIEGGWPNPTNKTDVNFYPEIRKINLKKSKIAAFGSTCRPGIVPEEDPGIKSLISTQAPVITIFGKSWDLHATQVIRTTLDENLQMIEKSIAFLIKNCDELIYDAEHFFDGYKENPEYALKTLEAAINGGAKWMVLCDTNGGCLPHEIGQITQEIRSTIDCKIGIHCHNDSGCADANSLMAVQYGATHIQGTMNGFGERCGNANLCTLIPDIELKMKKETVGKENLKKLKDVSLYVSEIANMHHDFRQPYVGLAAFSHKGGAHIDGVLKISRSFEHINPEDVGSERVFILSDQSGGSTLVEKLKKIIPTVDKKDPKVKNLLKKIKEMESVGYQFEAAEASFQLLAKKELGLYKDPFKFESFRVIEEKRVNGTPYSEATIKVRANGEVEHTAAEGEGPVNALDNAIRKAISRFYPEISQIRLTDYKVLVINAKSSTAARVRVLIESTDGNEIWGTVGVSENIVEASWKALIDSIEYKLLKDK